MCILVNPLTLTFSFHNVTNFSSARKITIVQVSAKLEMRRSAIHHTIQLKIVTAKIRLSWPFPFSNKRIKTVFLYLLNLHTFLYAIYVYIEFAFCKTQLNFKR